MSQDLDTLFVLYLLGELDAKDELEVERIVTTDPVQAARFDSFLDLVPPLPPSSELRERLKASLGAGRFDHMSAQIADMFDVTVDRARELLSLIDRAASWQSMIPGVQLLHVPAGPACANADCGFVRIDPHASFPWHAHRGEERCLVLAGSLSDHNGQTWSAGADVVEAAGTAHRLIAGNDGVLFVARVMNGIDLDVPEETPSR